MIPVGWPRWWPHSGQRQSRQINQKYAPKMQQATRIGIQRAPPRATRGSTTKAAMIVTQAAAVSRMRSLS